MVAVGNGLMQNFILGLDAGGLELGRVQTEGGEYFKKALLRVAGQIRSLDLDAFGHRDRQDDGRFSGIQRKIQSRRINMMHAKNG